MEPHRPLVPGTGEDCLVISVLVLSLRGLVHDVLPFSPSLRRRKNISSNNRDKAGEKTHLCNQVC